MKKIISSVLALCLLGFLFAFNLISSGGEIGRTGSPGETSCNNCHGGGAAGTTVSISATPSFTNNEFDPGTTYTITITVGHPSLSSFGFDCEVLTTGNVNAGTISTGGSGVQFGTFAGKKNATHTTPKAGTGSASWTFKWVPPATGNATIFAAGNAVNLNGNTNGDFSTTSNLVLSNIMTSIEKNTREEISQIRLFPNPANDITTLCYHLLSEQKITIELIDLNGKSIKTFIDNVQVPGAHNNIIDLKGISKGVYFIKTSSDGEKVSQKLISIF
jgi:hypothetical protein